MSDHEHREDRRLGDYLEGRLPLEEQRAYEEELLRDPAAANELYEELGVGQMLQARPRKSAVVRYLPWFAPLAAAAVVLVMLLPSGDPPTPVLRGDVAGIEIVEPAGQIEGDFVLRWRAVDGAAHYEVAIFSAAAEALFAGSTADTLLAVEAVDTGGEGFWRVTARDSLARPIAESAPVPLRAEK